MGNKTAIIQDKRILISYKMKKPTICILTAGITTTLPQSVTSVTSENRLASPAVIGTFVFIALVLTIAVILMTAKRSTYMRSFTKLKTDRKLMAFHESLIALEKSEAETPKAIPAWVWPLVISLAFFTFFYLILYGNPELN